MADDEFMAEHRSTWHDFCALFKWSLIGIVITLSLMGIFLVQ